MYKRQALKCNGTNEGALHKRIAVSVPGVDGTPDPSVFSESEMGDELMEVLGDENVECVLETRFHRKRFRIDTGTGIFELSVDKGTILTNYGEEPIFEVDVYKRQPVSALYMVVLPLFGLPAKAILI